MPGLLVQTVRLREATVSHCAFDPGWRWSRTVGVELGLTSCPIRHVGYCLSGRMHVQADDGRAVVIGAGSVFDVPPGHDKWVIGDDPWVAVEWGGSSRAAQAAAEDAAGRRLATVLFTDLVASTEQLRRLGDARWRDLLAAHDTSMRHLINSHRGREVATTGDGFLAVFDSPTRAVRCGAEMVRAATDLGLGIRVGAHTGEIEEVGDAVRGIAVHTAARVMAIAGDGEVLVSATTAALLEGSGLRLADAGTHRLKGLDGERRVFRLTTAPVRGGVAG